MLSGRGNIVTGGTKKYKTKHVSQKHKGKLYRIEITKHQLISGLPERNIFVFQFVTNSLRQAKKPLLQVAFAHNSEMLL